MFLNVFFHYFDVLMKALTLLYAHISLVHWKLAQVTMYVVNHNAYSTSKCLQTQEQLLHIVVSFPVPKGIRHRIREGSTTIRLWTFRLRHLVYRHFVYRYFVYYCIPGQLYIQLLFQQIIIFINSNFYLH